MGDTFVIQFMVLFIVVILALGLPVAFVLGSTGIVFGYFFWSPAVIDIVVLKANEMMRSTAMIAVGLFVFMAILLQESGIAEKLYDVMRKWMGALRGGLAAGTVVISTLIAAISGLSTTGVIMMGMLGYRSMVERGYDRRLVMGTIMGGSALGMLIPPSVMLILYGIVANVSIGRLFLAGIIPGLLISLSYVIYILVRCYINPSLGPPLPPEERSNLREKVVSLREVIMPIGLVALVLGTIFLGIATPTEAAAVGVVGAAAVALIYGRLSMKMCFTASESAFKLVAMIMWIVIGAEVFGSVYQGLGATAAVREMLAYFDIGPWAVLIIMQITWLLMGSLLEGGSILLITGPVFIPLAQAMGFDMVWFGILFTINVELATLSPPFGFNLFIMRRIVERSVPTMDIFAATVPFMLMHLLIMVLVMVWPGLATWLPALVF